MPDHYDNILKKMSTGLFNPNSNFGKDLDPNGFSNSFKASANKQYSKKP